MRARHGHAWARAYVDGRWVDREAFRRDSYYATGVDRLKVVSDADIVLFADADVIFVAGIDDLLESLVRAASGAADHGTRRCEPRCEG